MSGRGVRVEQRAASSREGYEDGKACLGRTREEKQGNYHGAKCGRKCGNSEIQTLAFYAESEFDQKRDDTQNFGHIKAKCS